MKEKHEGLKTEKTIQNTTTDNVKTGKTEGPATEQSKDKTVEDNKTENDDRNQESQQDNQTTENANIGEQKTRLRQEQEKNPNKEQWSIKANEQSEHQKMKKEKITTNVRKTIKRMISENKQIKQPQTQNWWPKDNGKDAEIAKQKTADEIKASLGDQNTNEYRKNRLRQNPKPKVFPDYEMNSLELDTHDKIWEGVHQLLEQRKLDVEEVNKKIKFSEDILDMGNVEEEENYLGTTRGEIKQEIKGLKLYVTKTGLLEQLIQEVEADEN